MFQHGLVGVSVHNVIMCIYNLKSGNHGVVLDYVEGFRLKQVCYIGKPIRLRWCTGDMGLFRCFGK